MKSTLVGIALIFGIGMAAQAQPKTADEMTCSEAVSYYLKHNRIWVWSNQDIIPIYGLSPVSKLREFRCPPKFAPRPYTVMTRDEDNCVIGYICLN